jgi:hypothetical protein
MPYKNKYNEDIARRVDMINRRHIATTDLNGNTQAINYTNPSVEPEGHMLSGFGHFGRIVGGGMTGCADYIKSTASKHYDGDKGELSGSAILGLQDGTLAGDRSRPISRVRKAVVKEPETNPRFGALGDALPSDIGLSDQNIPAAKYTQGYAQKDDSPLETQPISYAKAVGLGSGKRGRKPRAPCPCGSKTAKKCKCMKGGNGLATGTHMDTGFGETFGAEDNGGVKSSGNVDLKDTPSKKLRGSAILGLVKASTSKLDSTQLEKKPSPGVAKKVTDKSTPKKLLAKTPDKSQLPSSTLSGMGEDKPVKAKRQASAKTQERAKIVKKVMMEHGLSLIQASKYVKEHGLY